MELGTISTWKKKEGEKFEAGDVICEVETDKATVDFEAQDEGIIAKILVQKGTEVKVGDPIMVVVDDAALIASFANFAPGAASPATPVSVATPVAVEATPALAPSGSVPVVAAPVPSGGRVFASPLARKLAREKGFPIESVVGTGPAGRIVASDVEAHTPAPAVMSTEASALPALTAAPASKPAVSAPPTSGLFIDYPVSEDAMAFAAKLSVAKKEIPHYYLSMDIRLDSLLKVRSELNSYVGEGELSLNDFFLKAAALSMREVPEVNSSWMGTFIRQYKTVDINVYMNTTEGVVAPVIKGVDSKGLAAISGEVRCKATGAAQKSLPVSDFQVGTFSVANLGSYGVKSFSPIVNSPQGCILALGGAETRIIPNEDPASEQIYQEAVMLTATLSCDHRVVDGAVGAQWLATLKKYIENPLSMLL